MKKTFVGKDVIELLGNAMYLDPLSVYREYIQNSVDAIDEAISTGLLPDPKASRIDIEIDVAERNILIRDNGVGIPKSEFLERLLSIGASRKRKTSARGFRGVGRLAGLGFCQELIFRSRAQGESVCELRWDVRSIKSALAQYSGDGDIGDLIQDVTTFAELPHEGFPEHFFEVEMRKPLRLGGDTLMNIERVRRFISQTAPVPYSPSFTLASSVRAHLAQFGNVGEYNVFINDDDEPLCKPYEDTITYSETKVGILQGRIEPIVVESIEGEISAAGWIAHHDYQGAIPPSSLVGGLRARIGNIQIGERAVLADVFPEERFNSWTVGEIHIFDDGLIPNGRRDGFEYNSHLTNLKNKLLPYTHTVARQCRIQSSYRNARKRIELNLAHIKLTADILKQGALSAESNEAKIHEARGRIAESKKLLDSAGLSETEFERISHEIRNLEGSMCTDDQQASESASLQGLSEVERSAFNRVLQLVYDCSTNQASAKVLVDKILERL